MKILLIMIASIGLKSYACSQLELPKVADIYSKYISMRDASVILSGKVEGSGDSKAVSEACLKDSWDAQIFVEKTLKGDIKPDKKHSAVLYGDKYTKGPIDKTKKYFFYGHSLESLNFLALETNSITDNNFIKALNIDLRQHSIHSLISKEFVEAYEPLKKCLLSQKNGKKCVDAIQDKEGAISLLILSETKLIKSEKYCKLIKSVNPANYDYCLSSLAYAISFEGDMLVAEKVCKNHSNSKNCNDMVMSAEQKRKMYEKIKGT